MALYLSPEDVNNYINQLTRLVARTLRIVDSDVDSINELTRAINIVNLDIGNLLGAFLDAYKGWYGLHVEKCNGQIDDAIFMQRIDSHIKNRNNTRGALLDALLKILSKEESINRAIIDELEDCNAKMQTAEEIADNIHERAQENKRTKHK